MNVAVDTHALVFHLAGQSRRLGARGRRAFASAEAGRSKIHVPAIVLAEIVLLEQRGHLQIAYRELREEMGRRPAFILESLTPEDVDEARALGELPDPFDRLIVGTAIRLGVPLVTRDAAIVGSRLVPTTW